MGLEKLVRLIGSFIVALIIIAIPCICTLSFALNWDMYIKFIFTIMTIGYIAIQTMYIYYESEE